MAPAHRIAGRRCSEGRPGDCRLPGLTPARLYEGRDLAPTTDLRAVIKGVLHDHLGLAERVLAERVFPDSAPVKRCRAGG